jgi:hypothetical protein
MSVLRTEVYHLREYVQLLGETQRKDGTKTVQHNVIAESITHNPTRTVEAEL